jgi:hypothetical protein
MSTEAAISNALKEIENEMRRMLNGECAPYDAAWAIWRKAFSLATESPEIMHPFWLIWGSLTDWVETRPAETPRAESEMLRASREWLALEHEDAKCRKAYLDRWVFDEMGYERNGG